MSAIRNPDNHITFTCEDKECSNEKTVHRSDYDGRARHYCSMVCKNKNPFNNMTREERVSLKEMKQEKFRKKWKRIMS